MSNELLICIPGPWRDRSDFLRQTIALEPVGQWMFAGGILADVFGEDHVIAEVTTADAGIVNAFEIAAQGNIPPSTLSALSRHQSIVYLHFQSDIRDERVRLDKYSRLLMRLGGIAIKVESAGLAHCWERWFELLGGNLFDLYCAAVVLIRDDDHFYSCGMQHFGLPECAVSTAMDLAHAADLMNRFNFWQIAENPVFKSGHTFSLSEGEQKHRLWLKIDDKHEHDDAFFNPNGVWFLSAA